MSANSNIESKLDTELFNEVKRRILENPYNFDMALTIEEVDSLKKVGSSELCGTAACIAGFACIAKGYGHLRMGIMDQAEILLGITKEGRSRLFHCGSWDEPFSRRYEEAETPQERAEVAAQYIDYFVAKYSA